MAGIGCARPLILIGAVLLADSAAATQTNEYQCRRDGLMRRVQLGGGAHGDVVPCEVVYWKDSEQPGVGQILWNSAGDPQYCEDRARELVGQLRSWGWQCERLGEEAQAVLAAPLPGPPARAVRSRVRRREPARPADPAALADVIGHTVSSLRALHHGDFEAEIADYGDLDGDGFEDAVVVITYRAADGDQAQYLVAYLFDGQGFRAAASRNISGSPSSGSEGKVEQIVDGAILVEPSVAAAPCCRSGPAAFVLREGKLVQRE